MKCVFTVFFCFYFVYFCCYVFKDWYGADSYASH